MQPSSQPLNSLYSLSSCQPQVQLGKVDQFEYDMFIYNARQIWTELGNQMFEPADSKVFIPKAAERFKQMEQPLENAIDVLKAILTPEPNQTHVTFKQLCGFLAMFGPESSIMIKIASLLMCSNGNGQWLYFNKDDQYYSQLKEYGQFDENEPNCLNLIHVGVSKIRVWNRPLTSASEQYVIDENNNKYGSWEQYFKINPFPKVPILL